MQVNSPVMAGDIHVAVRSVKGCVVFDAGTGAIVHIHQVVTIEGAEEESDKQMIQRALTLAKERLNSGVGQSGSTSLSKVEFDALQVDLNAVDLRRPHRVELKSRTVIPIDAEHL